MSCPNRFYSAHFTKDLSTVDWNFFNSTPVSPRERVDTSAALEKPAAPKGDADGAKFARALNQASPREDAPRPTPPPTKNPLRNDAVGQTDSIERVSAPAGGKSITVPVENEKTSGLPKEIESLLKNTAPDAAPETISLVASLLLQGGSVKDNIPVLAVLTGDFSRLSAQEVPAVVLKSPFVAKALASDAVGDFLNQNASIREILSSLSIPRSAMSQLEMNGVNLDERVSPRRLLNAIGIDTQIVQAELQNLKGNLPVDGLKNYVERAKKHGPEVSAMVPAKREAAPLTEAIEIQVPTQTQIPNQVEVATGAIAQSPTPSPSHGALTPPAVPFTPAKNSADTPAFTDDVTSKAKLVTTSPFETVGEKMAGLSTTKMTMVEAAPQTPAVAPTPEKEALADKPDLKRHPENPETTLGDQTSFAAPETPREKTGVEALSRLLGAKADKAVALPEKNAPAPMPSERSTSFVAPSPEQPMEKPLTPARMMTTDELIARLQKPEARGAADPVAFVAEPAPAASSEDTKSFSDNEDEQPTDDTARRTDAPPAPHREAAGAEAVPKQNFKAELLETARPEHVAETRDKLHHRIFDHATMMLDEGGGSIRIDLGSKDMGVLDLAVNVRNDKLDLRIIASSESVREILTQDIPRLKDALSQQHLQLRNVEIAVGQSGAWTGQSGAGFRDSRQQAPTPREQRVGEVGRPTSFASRARSYIPGTRSALSAHTGRIQVLV